MLRIAMLGAILVSQTVAINARAQPSDKKVPQREERKAVSPDSINCFALSANGRFALTGGGKYRDHHYVDCNIRLWDLETLKEVGRFEGHKTAVAALAFAPDGQQFMSAGYTLVRLWDIKTRREVKKWQAHDLVVSCVAFSPDGKSVVTCGADSNSAQNLRLWNVLTGEEARRFSEQKSLAFRAVFSPDGRRILSAGGEKSARLWDANTAREIHRFASHDRDVTSVAFTPDGKYILTGCTGRMKSDTIFDTVPTDNPVYIWDATTGKEVRRLYGHLATIDGIAVSADGKRVLSAGGGGITKDGKFSPVDCTIRLWDFATGKEIHIYSGHDRPILAVAFLPDGKHFVSASFDRTIRVWRLPEK